MKNGLDCTRQYLQFLWCLAKSNTKLFPTRGCHRLCKPCCPRAPEGELQHRHNNSLHLWGGSQRYTWALNLLLVFRSNNWALHTDFIWWFHWDYRSSTGMLSKGAVFLGQTLGSINLITALFIFKQSIFGAFYWFFIQDTFHFLMIQLFLTTSFWNCPHHMESYFSNPLNTEDLSLI